MATKKPTAAQALAEVLADAFFDPKDIKLLCGTAHFPLKYIKLDGRAIDIWMELCECRDVETDTFKELVNTALDDKRARAYRERIKAAADAFFSSSASAASIKDEIAKKLLTRASRSINESHSYLCFDRTRIWNTLQASVTAMGLRLLPLCCEQNDGHNYLFSRIYRYRAELNAQILELRSDVFALDPDDFPVMLFRPQPPELDNPKWKNAFNECSKTELINLLAEITVQKTLILLYPAAHTEQHIDWLSRHNCDVLPAQYKRITAARQSGGKASILAIQPIVWEPRPWERWGVKVFGAHDATHRLLQPLLKLPSTELHSKKPDYVPLHLDKTDERDILDFLRTTSEGDPQRIEERFARIEPLIEKDSGSAKIFEELEHIWLDSLDEEK